MQFICEYCGSSHDGSYGSGRFCSPKCSRKYANRFVTKEGRDRQVSALNDPENRKKNLCARHDISEQKKQTAKSKPKVKTDKSTIQLGKIGELAIIKKFISRGIPVYTPVVDSGADIIADLCGNLKKIQVKTSAHRNKTDTATIFDLTTGRYISDECSGNRRLRHTNYSLDEVDYFALYDFLEDRAFIMKNRETGSISLRDENAPIYKGVECNPKSRYDMDRFLDLIELGIDPDSIIEE